MPRASNKVQSPPPDFKVFIRNAQGHYLAQDDHGLFFTNDRTSAVILDYRDDQVESQLEMIRKVHGVALVSDPVPAEEIYETCDRCRELFLPIMTFFDGKQFLCPDCRTNRKDRPPSRRHS